MLTLTAKLYNILALLEELRNKEEPQSLDSAKYRALELISIEVNTL